MKILLANKFYYPRGGDCVYTIGLEKLLLSKGHQVAVFSMHHPENLAHAFQDYWLSTVDFSDKSFKNIRELFLRPIFSTEVKEKFLKLVNHFKPDIVHLNNIHSQISPLIAEVSYKRGIPVVWTLHDYKLVCPAYECLREGKPCELCFKNKINVLTKKCIKGSYVGSFIGLMEALKWNPRKLQLLTNAFISPSNFLKGKMVEGGFDGEKISVINNFVAEDKIVTEIAGKLNYYCYFGRLSKAKGVETLLRVASKLTEHQLKVIGTGPLEKELREKYKARNIEFVGHKTWDDLRKIVMNARFSVVPSEWYENYPLSIVESFGLGTPVVGANIGGIPELVKNNETGLLFEPGSSDELAEKIRYMFGNDEHVKTMERNALGLVRMNNLSESYYSKLLPLYERIILPSQNKR